MSLIRNSKQTKQGIDFTGLQNGKIHPTDIDAVLEFDDEILICFEMKRRGNEMEDGQKLVYQRIVDAWIKCGKYGYVLKIEHDFKDDNLDVPIELCEVTEYYSEKGVWEKPYTGDVKTLLNDIGNRCYNDKLNFV